MMPGSRSRATVVLLCVFTAGILAGIFYERHLSARANRPMSPEEHHRAAMTEMGEILELDEQQTERVHAILAERQLIVQAKWEELRPEVTRAMNEVNMEIAELLRPDQRRRFHEWLNRRAEEHRRVTPVPHER